VRELIRENVRFFTAAVVAGLLLRIGFILFFPSIATDSFIYGDIAKNWLQHGVYGVSEAAQVVPTYIRLPGYPAFLALIFSIFGMEHYRAVLLVQMFVDIGTCFLCGSIALHLFGGRAARIAVLLAAICPFLANYSAAVLTETLEIFFTAFAFDSALRALEQRSMRFWIICGVASSAAILLRPDGAIVPAVILLYLAWLFFRKSSEASRRFIMLRAMFAIALICVLPLVFWGYRNWHVFHRFQPLAPRYANEENEFVPMGFNRWVKTWMADYVSVEEVYWAVPGSPIDVEMLPPRTFDNASQHAETAQVISDYNSVLHISPELDRRFKSLADERMRSHPVRYYLGLPLLRIADMWCRPRTEMLPSDTRWWEFNDEPKWSALAIGFGAIGLFYCTCGAVGWLRTRAVAGSGLLMLFVVLRSGFLGTLENPEPRYTLEMYPVVIVFAAVALAGRKTRSGAELKAV
jgi:4-amino-4-deoxy-L-arabinose transferase-like glycosyltransferase